MLRWVHVPALGGLQSPTWLPCAVCCGQLPCQAPVAQGGPGTGVAEPVIPCLALRPLPPSPVTLGDQILGTGRDIIPSSSCSGAPPVPGVCLASSGPQGRVALTPPGPAHGSVLWGTLS